MKNKSPRSFFSKENFLSGNRQRWALIFLCCGAALFTGQIIWHIDPTPYMTFLTFLGSFVIGGATLSDFIKTRALSSTSTFQNSNLHEEKVVEIHHDIEVDKRIIGNQKDDDYASDELIEDTNYRIIN